jgi:plasmid stabilization system protein ParE
MRARYTATARVEIDAILSHIAVDNPPAALAVATAIKAAVARLRYFRRVTPDTNDPNVHMQIAEPYGYLIFYSVEGDDLMIRHVWHPSRQRPLAD